MASKLLSLTLLAILVCGVIASPDPKKVFTRCELVRFLQGKGSSYVRTWTCLANYESAYNSAAMGGPNSNGSYDHGMWQVNDNYWCYNPSNPGLSNDCNINCSSLRDDDLNDDWDCVVFIYGRHGFSAWSTYGPYCTNAENESSWDSGC